MRLRILACALLTLAAALPAGTQTAGASDAQTAAGRSLFQEGCSSCHGMQGGGVPGRGPSLHGAGAAAADFYLSTGRMPLSGAPGDEPLRSDPVYDTAQIAEIAAYVASLGPGPAVPAVHPQTASVAGGRAAFTTYCAGCHQIAGQGGVVIGAVAPSLADATPTQIAEAVRVGPYLMPRFDETVIDDRTLDGIIRYVQLTRHPDDRGGLGIGHIGPVPEGMVAWFVALAALLLVARIIGERRIVSPPPDRHPAAERAVAILLWVAALSAVLFVVAYAADWALGWMAVTLGAALGMIAAALIVAGTRLAGVGGASEPRPSFGEPADQKEVAEIVSGEGGRALAAAPDRLRGAGRRRGPRRGGARAAGIARTERRRRPR